MDQAFNICNNDAELAAVRLFDPFRLSPPVVNLAGLVRDLDRLSGVVRVLNVIEQFVRHPYDLGFLQEGVANKYALAQF